MFENAAVGSDGLLAALGAVASISWLRERKKKIEGRIGNLL